MAGIASLLAALGLVAVLFALLSFVLALFGAPSSASWIFGNLGIGVALLVTAASTNIDKLRERMHTGEARRVGRFGSSAIASTMLALAIVGMLSFLATRYHLRFDWSEQHVHSLSDQSQKVLAGLDRDVDVVALYSPLRAGPVHDLLDRYDYASDHFKIVEFADPNARPDLLQRYKIDPDQVRNGLVRVAIGDDSVSIEDPSEEKITNAIVKLTRAGQKTVYFLEGHNERAIKGEQRSAKESYARAAEALRNENYRVEPLLLAAKGEVPEDASALIIAGPTRPLLGPEHKALQEYLRRGGSLMLLVDPRAKTDLVAQAKEWGVDIGDDVVVDRTLALLGRATTPFASKYDPDSEITKDLRDVTLFHFVRSVQPEDKAKKALKEIVFTGENSWAERDLKTFFDKGRAELGEGDLAGPVPIAVAGQIDLAAPPGAGDGTPDVGTGNAAASAGGAEAAASAGESSDGSHPARLVVFGDSDFASNELIDAYLNRDLFVNSVNWLVGDVEAISIRPPMSRASRFLPSAAQFEWIRVLSLFVLPEALAVLGVITWWTRRQGPAR